MDRWNGMAFRAYRPALGALLVAVVSTVALSNVQAGPLLAGLLGAAYWVPMAALVVTLGLVIAPTYRLVRWQRGEGPVCPSCHGPLGPEHDGHARMGGAYRQCYMCGKNINHRYYE